MVVTSVYLNISVAYWMNNRTIVNFIKLFISPQPIFDSLHPSTSLRTLIPSKILTHQNNHNKSSSRLLNVNAYRLTV